MLRRAGCILVPFSTRLCANGRQISVQKSLVGLSGRIQHSKLLTSQKLTMATDQITPEMNLCYADIVKLIQCGDSFLIDVREPHELEQDGRLPKSTNIPLNDVKVALELPPDEFRNRYGICLPSKDDVVVFSCRSGGRSKKALMAALQLGFRNSKHYAGGYLDWAQHTQA